MPVILASLLALAVCAGTVGIALKALAEINPPQTVRHELPPAARPEPDRRAEAAAQQRESEQLEKQLLEVRRTTDDLQPQAQAAPERIRALQRHQDQLKGLIDQRRAELRDYADALRRQTAQQETDRQRLERLRAEAAELERRIAELKASIARAQEALRARSVPDPHLPQIAECVPGAIILQPQHLRIPLADLPGNAFAHAVAGRGVRFLVKPDGIDSFVAARAVARALDVTIGYAPVLPGSKP
jgi:hypothetical protein